MNVIGNHFGIKLDGELKPVNATMGATTSDVAALSTNKIIMIVGLAMFAFYFAKKTLTERR
jgi:hypothetical protein